MSKKALLKNSLIQQWIFFVSALFLVILIAILITPRRSIYVDETKKNDQSILNKVECRCLGIKDPLTALPEGAPYYEERCVGLIMLCKEYEIQLKPTIKQEQ